MKSKKPTVLFVVGPTASGKTKAAIALAKHLSGEIVSADSMQIYKSMDIGTAKPSKREQAGIPHYLFDIVSPKRNYSVYDYRKRALRSIASIVRRKKVPIVVGGTGLYVRALLEGIEELPKKNQALRKKLEKKANREGVENLYRELKKKSPARARKIKPTDLKRIIRALEIWEGEKKGFISKKSESLKKLGYRPIVIGLKRDRETLYADINRRVDQMFRRGLVKEVKGLVKAGLSQTASQAVGYKELLDAFEEKCSLAEARELVKRNSRRLAKRQMTWFRKEKGIEWVDFGDRRPASKALLESILPVLNEKVRKS